MKIIIGRLSALFLTLFLVIANAILIETILDMYGIRGHRLFTGFFGTLVIILSFGYSLRKRKKYLSLAKLKAGCLPTNGFPLPDQLLFLYTLVRI